jgi:protein-S-isoprenylcysteine O-methyltransferase Ste14
MPAHVGPSRTAYRLRGVLVAVPAVAALLAPPSATLASSLFWLGIVLVLAGWLVRMWAQVHLGYRLDRRMALVACGPFRFCRNPIYLANAAVVLGVVAASETPWEWFVLAVVWCVLVFAAVVAFEEHRLRRTYGEAYGRYCAAVHAWLPRRPAPAPACEHHLTSDVLFVESLVPLVLLPVLVRSLLLG